MIKTLICYGLLTVAITVVGMSSVVHPTAANGSECSNDLRNLATKCMPYVMYPPNPKIGPSKDCCGVVQNCDMQCVCDHVTKAVEKMICMEKVVYVANACGRPLAKGSKCGSYLVPPM